jgi:hypothetical protein
MEHNKLLTQRPQEERERERLMQCNAMLVYIVLEVQLHRLSNTDKAFFDFTTATTNILSYNYIWQEPEDGHISVRNTSLYYL